MCTYIHTTESLCSTAETNNHCKSTMLQLKIKCSLSTKPWKCPQFHRRLRNELVLNPQRFEFLSPDTVERWLCSSSLPPAYKYPPLQGKEPGISICLSSLFLMRTATNEVEEKPEECRVPKPMGGHGRFLKERIHALNAANRLEKTKTNV